MASWWCYHAEVVRLMCGISGIFDPRLAGQGDEVRQIASTMAERISHRGPDRTEIWQDEALGLALGHNRLAIIDLSERGNQPMISGTGRYVIVFNGEIYNFLDLRRDLAEAGTVFRGRSDTEVLLNSIEVRGLEVTLQRIIGMYAFALYDRERRRLHLVRDKLGKKPLYFGWVGDAFLFASELKSIASHPQFKPEVDRQALTAYFRHLYIPAPLSIWHGIFKLPPGCTISLDLNRKCGAASDRPGIDQYWNMCGLAEDAARRPVAAASPDEWVQRLEDILSTAVTERMIADVPLGAFLSGGVDSSVVVALMQQYSTRPVKTFSIGFSEAFFDEAQAARAVAKHLGTEHHEHRVSAADALASVAFLPDVFDEPFADPSAIPTLHVARVARQDVTVCLSGDGGDEIFSGYGRYALARRLGRVVDVVPELLRRLLSKSIRGISAEKWDLLLRLAPLWKVDGLRGGWSGHRLHKLSDLLTSRTGDELYRSLTSVVAEPTHWVIGGAEPEDLFGTPTLAIDDPIRRMMYGDTIGYLPDDILVKVDRTSMSVSLEARSPLLDQRVLELGWSMPVDVLWLDGKGKWPLRQLFSRYLPAEWSSRPKQGFGIPVNEWLRGPLRGWVESLIDPARLAEEGFLNPYVVAKAWNDHLTGRRDFGTQIWAVVMFQAWRERWFSGGESFSAHDALDRCSPTIRPQFARA